MLLWYICLILGLALMVLAARLVMDRALGKLRTAWALLALAGATYVLYIPAFFGSYNFFTALFGGILNVFQVVSLDADYTAFYDMISSQLGTIAVARVYLIALGIVHVLMPVTSLVVAYNVLMYCFSGLQMVAVNRRSRPLYIFSELNDASLELAESIKANVPRRDIVFANCLDRDQRKDSREMHEYVLHHENVTSIRISQRSKREVYYFCIGEDEETNLNDTLELIARFAGRSAQEQRRLHIYCFSQQSDLDVMIDSTQKGLTDVRPVNRSECVAYTLLDQYPLCRYSREGVVSVLLFGLDDVNTAVLKAAAWCGQMAGSRLKIRAVGMNLGAREAQLRVRCPDLFTQDRFDIAFYDCPHMAQAMDTVRLGCMDATYVVVDGADEGETVEAALCLRRLLYHRDGGFDNEPPIFAHIRSEAKYDMVRGLRTPESDPSKRRSYHIIPFGNDSSVYNYEQLLCSPLDYLSKNIHMVYEDIPPRAEGVDVPAALERYNLLEVNKRSNRANAMHIRYKLASLGLDYTQDPNAEEVELSDYLTQDKLDALARAEHDRWMAFLETEGWTTATLEEVKAYQASGISAGRHNCPLLKQHPYICPYEDLPACSAALGKPDSTVYDYELIRRIPEILHDRWNISRHKYKIIRADEREGGSE